MQRKGWCLLPHTIRRQSVARATAWVDAAAASPSPDLEREFEPESLGGRLAVRKIRRLNWHDLRAWDRPLDEFGLRPLPLLCVGPSLQPLLLFHTAVLKSGCVTTAIGLRQDQGLRDDEHPAAISMWVVLSRSTRFDGCLEMSSGSHRSGRLPHRRQPGHPWHACAAPAAHGLLEPTAIEMQAGDVLVWDRHLVHGRGGNHSSRDRKSVVMVFPPSAGGALPLPCGSS